MYLTLRNTGLLLILLAGSIHTQAQTAVKETPKGWHLLDKTKDGFYGIGSEKAYETLLKGKKAKKTVVVAVIDSGVDTTHEDLKPILWHNPGEIPGNGIDDDKNGYVDDIYGWNFLGGKDGRNVSKDSYEGARIYYKFKPRFGDSTLDLSKLNADDKRDYQLYTRSRDMIESQAKEAAMYVVFLKNIVEKLPTADSILKKAVGKEKYTGDELTSFKPASVEESKAKNTILGLFQQTQQMDASNKELIDGVMEFYDGEKAKVDAAEHAPEDYRGEIVKDNYDDPNDRFYGNGDVMAGTPMHGTHVTGIIAAARHNGKGMDGVADNVKVMMVRAVPDGDEHDKDIANAIRYAVDNGAWVINMSFGKSFSPEKRWVDEAVKYAESKGVLLVHAAGNDHKNVDVDDNFPNNKYGNDPSTRAGNWVTVGASGPDNNELVADFSNYGKNDVDLFSPGVKIYSTLPGGDAYGNQQGTSMASPVVAGVAALILSYYPELSARQVKMVLEKSAQPAKGVKAIKPGTEEEVPLSELSRTGGIVNAYEAIKLAGTLKGERKMAPTTVPPPKTSLKKKPVKG